MNYRNAVKGACEEIIDSVDGMDHGDHQEVDIQITDPPIILDFLKIAHESVREVERPPNLYEPKITIYGDDFASYFPWLSSFSDYIESHQSILRSPMHVSFVESTKNKNTKRSYLRQRRDTLEDLSIDREQQILIPLPNRIPENLTQILTVYFLVSKGWMVADDTWFSPRLQFSPLRRAPNYGIPDIVAWKSEFTNSLKETGWIRGGGTMHELAMLSERETLPNQQEISFQGSRTLVGEVKYTDSSFGEAAKQLYENSKGNPRYLKSETFDEGYGVVALERERNRDGAGTISFDENGFIFEEDSMNVDWYGDKVERGTRADPEKKRRLIKHLNQIASQTLLCNLSTADLFDLIELEDATSPNRVLEMFDSLSTKQISSKVGDHLDIG